MDVGAPFASKLWRSYSETDRVTDLFPAASIGLIPTAQGGASAAGGISDHKALLSLLGGVEGLSAEDFATLLSGRLAEASPEMLQEMLGGPDGRSLPQDGKDLPLEALLALLAGAAGAPTIDVLDKAGGGPGRALPTLVREPSARPPGDVGLQTASTAGADPLGGLPAPPAAAGRVEGPLPGATPAASTPVEVPVGHPGWERAVGQRVLWLVDQQGQAAQLRLNPPELGPLEVRLRMDGDQVHLSFAAGHVQVREALEQALPRLRELFAEAGLSLGNVDVSQQGPGGQADDGGGSNGPLGGDETPGGGAAEGAPVPALRRGAGLVDTFA